MFWSFHLEFHVSIDLFRAEFHLFPELLQCHVGLLNLLPLVLPGLLQLFVCLPSNQTLKIENVNAYKQFRFLVNLLKYTHETKLLVPLPLKKENPTMVTEIT